MKAWLGAAALMTTACAADAATWTIIGAEGTTSTHTADGVTADAGDRWVTGLMTDGGTPYARQLTFTMTGRFDAVGFDFTPVRWNYQICTEDLTTGETVTCESNTYDNVLVQGIRDGGIIATSTFRMIDLAEIGMTGRYTFADEFQNLDALLIGFTPVPWPIDPGKYANCGNPCSQFYVNRLDLKSPDIPAPVPLPASLPLLSAALAGLMGLRQRRRT
ncbi:VPLPA-CTERM sorting domain-containing protein [Rubellimicrobium roseum]|uniref:VPLPA-CTERM sorting domain-containing protein n=1 Tax=Rubellimicrobium roseum TaxID=687525 RepID=A0A5C4N384_9RHOB|nr:VPLPA-CTERM sorting domain-containing protein [Rubellimicrobium roseum]TNC59442.1 hypothetical protein FHG71_22740 [Rubellimicrobium roseum]